MKSWGLLLLCCGTVGATQYELWTYQPTGYIVDTATDTLLLKDGRSGTAATKQRRERWSGPILVWWSEEQVPYDIPENWDGTNPDWGFDIELERRLLGSPLVWIRIMVGMEELHNDNTAIAFYPLWEQALKGLVAADARLPGDANLDCWFTSEDLVYVMQAGYYENEGSPASWTMGDWDGSGRFTSEDMVLAFQTGMYEVVGEPEWKPRAVAVPEPSAMVLFLLGLACQIGRRR